MLMESSMFKGFLISFVSYALFIVLPFLYLLMTVYTLVTKDDKLALHSEAGKQARAEVYQA